MQKNAIKIIVGVGTFLISLVLISIFMNQGTTDMTTEMKAAGFPLIYINTTGEDVNCLHGYSVEMESNYLRGTLNSLDEERNVSITVEQYNSRIQGLSFEVRSNDGERLVESTDIREYTTEDNAIKASFKLKDLIEPDVEYNLILIVKLETGEIVRYYTRVFQSEGYHQKEMTDFVREFSNNTFDKERAKAIIPYAESNEEGDNTTFHKVDIHSSFSQITWGDLQVKKEAEPIVYVREITPDIGSLEIQYVVSLREGKETKFYNVTEYYTVRYTPERMYLLEFERTMDVMFNPDNNNYASNKIMIGITGAEIELRESDDGNNFAFIQENRLFSYNVTENKMARLFGFYDKSNADLRTIYSEHGIKILNIDETGNVRFMVYGYMNRGQYEGRVGVQVYYFNYMLNTIEEEVFIPYTKSYGLLEKELETLTYVSRTNNLYLIMDNTLYMIDLLEKSYTPIVENINRNSYKVSESQRMVVWEDDLTPLGSQTLCLMNLNTKKQTKISAGSDKYVKPLGFMGEDLIYGVANERDIVEDNYGSIIFPMYMVKIQNESGSVLKTYEQTGYYVIDAQIEENQINLKRVTKDRGSEDKGTDESQVMDTVSENDIEEQEEEYIVNSLDYSDAIDDQIMNTEEKEAGRNTIEVVVTQEYEKLVQIVVKTEIAAKKTKVLTPKEVLYEGGRELALSNEMEKNLYYVYSKGKIQDIHENPANAVNAADEVNGVVINDKGDYVWKRKGNAMAQNQIMKIEKASVTEEKSSLVVCLDTILKAEGIMKNSDYLFSRGATVFSILEDNLEDAQILDLSGCSLNSVLYYVNRDIPVLALLKDGNAVLIVGFNELNTVLMDPVRGEILKMGMNDSRAWFKENGNRFITYIK